MAFLAARSTTVRVSARASSVVAVYHLRCCLRAAGMGSSWDDKEVRVADEPTVPRQHHEYRVRFDQIRSREFITGWSRARFLCRDLGEEGMRSFLEFIGPWGGYIAFTAASLLFLLWLGSIDGDSMDEKVASSLLWAALWPLRWFYCRLVRRDANFESSFADQTRMSAVGPQIDSPQQREKGFRTIRAAKDYLASKIADEAQRNGTPLTEVEMKMLYFTETGWTLPDMKQVSAEFDRDYDQNEFEQKIGELANRIQVRFAAQGQQDGERWGLALEKLSHGDHYISILVNGAQLTRKGLRHNLKVLIIALALFAYVALDNYIRRWMRDH